MTLAAKTGVVIGNLEITLEDRGYLFKVQNQAGHCKMVFRVCEVNGPEATIQEMIPPTSPVIGREEHWTISPTKNKWSGQFLSDDTTIRLRHISYEVWNKLAEFDQIQVLQREILKRIETVHSGFGSV